MRGSTTGWLIALGVLVVVATGLLAIALAWRWRPPALASFTVVGDVAEAMQELAEVAVADSKTNRGLELDYTSESIQHVERVLGQVHDDFRARRMSREHAEELAIRYGAYTGETIRRTWGGAWAKDHPQVGPDSFPMAVKGLHVFPIAWCQKRVVSGPDDNVWAKYHLSIGSPPPEVLDER
jgi:hypothetical protein